MAEREAEGIKKMSREEELSSILSILKDVVSGLDGLKTEVGNVKTNVAVLTERVEEIKKKQEEQWTSIEMLKNLTNRFQSIYDAKKNFQFLESKIDNHVKDDKDSVVYWKDFKWTQAIVYGASGMVLIAFFSFLISLAFKQQG